MERSLVRNYLALVKPGIIAGNVLTCAAGGAASWTTLAGLSCMVAAGCIGNNWFDQKADAIMERTKHRPTVTRSTALMLTTGCACSGIALLSGLSLVYALFGLFCYLGLYSPAKYRTPHATLIGAVAGAMPPLVGYGKFDGTAFALFALLLLWQMPHFYAIALNRRHEYEAAGIPLFPIATTRWLMRAYLLIFLPVALWFTPLAIPIVLPWIALSYMQTTFWARKMFLFSLVVIAALSLALLFGW